MTNRFARERPLQNGDKMKYQKYWIVHSTTSSIFAFFWFMSFIFVLLAFVAASFLSLHTFQTFIVPRDEHIQINVN
jgi:type IV secretory pathway component VirB8